MPPQPITEAVLETKVRLLRAGSGSTILFLHGANGFPGWLPLFEQLSADHEVIIPEHPSFGASEDAPKLRNVADYAYYYLDFIEKMGLTNVHLVGHSLGGWISTEIAVRNCSRLASLTLLAPAGVRRKGFPPGDNFIWTPQEATRKLFMNQAMIEQMLARVPTEEEQIQMVRTRLMAARLGWEPRWFNPHLGKWLHRVKVPTMLVWGADDALLPAAWAQSYIDAVPTLAFHSIENCGHSPHVEKAAEVLPLIREHVQNNRVQESRA